MAKSKKELQLNAEMFLALSKRDKKAFKELLFRGGDLLATDPESGWGVLHFVCYTGDSKLLSELLQNTKLKINALTLDGSTPLIIASSRGHEDCVAVLLEKKASVNHQDSLGQTALLGAVDIGNMKIIEMLLKSDADLTIRYTDREAQSVERSEELKEEFGANICTSFNIMELTLQKAKWFESSNNQKRASLYREVLAYLEQVYLDKNLLIADFCASANKL